MSAGRRGWRAAVWLAAGCAVWVLAVTGLAAPEPPAPLPEAAAVLTAAGTVTREAYPDADDVLVDDLIVTVYEPDGTSRTWDDTYLKILTERGRRERSTLALAYTLPYGTAAFAAVEVFKPDGTRLPVDVAAAGREMVDPGQMSANIYNPNDKLVQVSVPGLEIGDVLRIYTFRDEVKPRVPGTWSDYQVFESTMPIVRLRYDVRAPAGLLPRHAELKAPVAGTVEAGRGTLADGREQWSWEVRDVPRYFPEPGMPAAHTVVQRLLLSTIEDWPALSRWYWELSLPHLEAVTDAMRAQVEALTAGAADRHERIERLFRFVSQEIRYMGITTETEAPGYEPHDVSMTYENRYGVCRDKAALLVAMLRLAGLPAYPVLINVGPLLDADVPQPFFNHAVVAVEEEPGGYLLMDPTDENTRELMPAYLEHRSYLVARPEGEALLVSPVRPAAQNAMRIESHGWINEEETLHMASVLRFEGVNDTLSRGALARRRDAQRRRFFEARVREVIPGARLAGLEIEPADVRDTRQPLCVRLQIEAPGALARRGGAALLPPPWLGGRFGYANMAIGPTGLETRRFPLRTEMTALVEESLDIEWPAFLGEPAEAVQASTLGTGGLRCVQRLEATNRVLRGQAQLAVEAVEFDPAAYAGLRGLMRDREREQRRGVLFPALPGDAAGHDVEILDDATRVDVTGPGAWTVTRDVRKRVLTYAGAKRHAEWKLDFNPAWAEVVEVSATVSNADGRVQAVAEEARNLMDADWVGTAPRYPAERRLVLSLPAVQVGSVIETHVVMRRHGLPFVSERFILGGFDPVRAARLELRAPAGSLPRLVTRLPGAGVEASVRDGQDVRVWTLGPQAGRKAEPGLPPAWEWAPTVMLSTGDWAAYAGQVFEALEAAAAAPGVEAWARRLAPAGSDTARALAIRDAAWRAVREAGPGLEALPLTAVTAADRVLAEGYGNTADRAVLLAAALRAVGLEAEWVLVSSWAPRVEEAAAALLACPQRDVFDRVAVRVRTGDGWLWIADTDQYAPLGATPYAGRACLGRDGVPGVVEVSGAYADATETRDEIEVQADGSLRLTRTERVFGMPCGAWRRLYAELSPEERRRHALELVSAVARGAVPEGDLQTDFEGYPGVRTFSARLERYGVRSGPYLYVELPPADGAELPVEADRREGALMTARAVETRRLSRLVLPSAAAEVLLAPGELDWAGPDGVGRLRRRVGEERGADGRRVLEVEETTALRDAVVDPANYAALLEQDRRWRAPGGRLVLLRLEAPLSGASGPAR